MTHRTALITAGSIAAVVFAGAIAVGVNLGILSVADSRPVGTLSAATDFQATASKSVRVYAADPKTADSQGSQTYVIKKAGSLKVAFSKAGVRLMDVDAKPHWTWALAQSADKRLTVTFRSGPTTYKFIAAVSRDGSIVARVDQPITRAVKTPSSAGAPATPVMTTAGATNAAPAGGDEPESDGGGEADD